MMSPSDVVVALGSPPSAVTEQCVEHLAAARLSVDATMGNFPAQHAALSTTVRARFT